MNKTTILPSARRADERRSDTALKAAGVLALTLTIVAVVALAAATVIRLL